MRQSLRRSNRLIAGKESTVQLAQGRFRGRGNEGYQTFAGIPYAKQPVASRRWRAPEPITSPSRFVADATAFGPMAPQISGDSASAVEMDEGCLNLNVWCPKDAKAAPVMVWIHGGGFCQGSNRCRGSVFAKAGVVLVAPNYRLGLLGFMSHQALDDHSANFGLLDLVEALRWVRDNIEAFGGDPNNVSIFGVSAGGQAVNLLMVMQSAAGLFHQAISQSGYGTWPLLRANPDEGSPLDLMGQSAEVAEVAATQTLRRAGAAASTLAELLGVNAGQIVSGQQGFQRPIVDGSVIAEEPGMGFDQGQMQAVPYLAGANSFDGSVLPSYQLDPERYRRYWDNYQAAWRSAYASEIDEEVVVKRLFGDQRYLFSSWKLTEAIGRRGGTAYRYYLDVAVGDEPKLGTPHGFDAFLLFEAEVSLPGTALADWGRRLRQAWISFAETQQPRALIESEQWSPVGAGSDWHRLGRASGITDSELKDRISLLNSQYEHRIA